MTASFQATSIGEIVLEQIRNGMESLGEVANTFEKSLYVRTTSGHLLHITSRVVRSPVTVNLEAPAVDFQTLAKPSEKVEAIDEAIRVGEHIFRFDGAALYRNGPLAFDPRALGAVPTYLEEATTILRILEKEMSVIDELSPSHDKVASAIAGIIGAVKEGRSQNLIDSATELVGLGGGFTPVGDDFVGGFLVAHNALGSTIGRDRVNLPLALLAERTTWASAQLLNYMQNLILDEQLERILRAVASGSGEHFQVEMMDFVPRGHTSGLDILAGLVVGLSVVSDMNSGGHLTSNVLERLGFS